MKKTLEANHSLRLLLRSSRPENLDVCYGPLSSTFDYEPFLRGCDIVIHCAAIAHQIAGVSKSTRYTYFDINCEATVNLAKCADKVGIRHFIFLSSAKVCGEVSRRNKPFTADAYVNASGAYAESKACAERQLLCLSENMTMTVSIVRPPLVYGPGVKGNLAILMKLVALRIPFIDCTGAGSRSMISIWNLCSFIEALIRSGPADSEIYMVSDGSDCTTLELMSFMAAARDRRILSIPLSTAVTRNLFNVIHQVDIYNKLFENFQVDIRKSCDLLKWRPIHNTRYGIQKTFHSS